MCEFLFTATILLEKHGSGTKYTALAQHRDNASKTRHEQMGFEEGWRACLDQLVLISVQKCTISLRDVRVEVHHLIDFTRFTRHIIMSQLERRVKNEGHQIYSRI